MFDGHVERSTRVRENDRNLFSLSPTAKQPLGVGHDTPLRNEFGLDMIDHRVPFQCSTSVVAGGPVESECVRIPADRVTAARRRA